MATDTVPAYILVARWSGAEVNFRFLDDRLAGSRVKSLTILSVRSSSVVLVTWEVLTYCDDVIVSHVTDDVMTSVTVTVRVWVHVDVGS